MKQGEHGQSAVELMLVLPFVLFVIMALAELGAAFYAYITINNSTSEAARWAAVANLPDDTCANGSIQWRAGELSQGILACDGDTVFDVTYEDASSGHPARGTGVTVRITHTYNALTPLPALMAFVTGGAFPASWEMSACSDARLEQRLPEGTYVGGSGYCGA